MTKRIGFWFLAGGLVVSLLLAGVVSSLASSSPDGLEHAAQRGCAVDADGEIVAGSCLAQQEREHDLAGGWFADYGVRGLDNDWLATGLAGVVGVLVTFAVGGGLFWLVRRRRPAGE
ncbi:MAG: cobalamin biosynthesis protein CbiM [Micromonosporaceae bacterium]|nr:cobalamin biosynthesis protein CbiM [Micromonosporaceae bacterium]